MNENTDKGRYTIIGRIPDGIYVAGYVLVDNYNNAKKLIDKSVVEKLALSKKIKNVQAQIYNDAIVMKGKNCKLSELPEYKANGELIVKNKPVQNNNVPSIKIIGKFVKNNNIIDGYMIEYNNDKVLHKTKVDRKTILKLAREGKIINAKAQLNQGQLILRGIGEELTNLPTIKI